MSRWNLERRTHTPRVPEPEAEMPSDRHHLTQAEVRIQRLELAEDMLELVCRDGQTLPTPVQRTLQGLCEKLGQVRKQTKGLS
jgi:hypothetical protein